MCRFKPEVARHLVLQILYSGREELDHLTARCTDHVIMMLVIVMMLVVGFVIAEPDLTRQSSFRKQF